MQTSVFDKAFLSITRIKSRAGIIKYSKCGRLQCTCFTQRHCALNSLDGLPVVDAHDDENITSAFHVKEVFLKSASVPGGFSCTHSKEFVKFPPNA